MAFQKKRFSKQLELHKKVRKIFPINPVTKRIDSMKRVKGKAQVRLDIKKQLEEDEGISNQ